MEISKHELEVILSKPIVKLWAHAFYKDVDTNLRFDENKDADILSGDG